MKKQRQAHGLEEDVTGQAGLLSTVANVREFMMAGNARITLVSKKTKRRFTYRVATPQGKTDPWFVSVLVGEDNEGDYSFFGTLFDEGKTFRYSKKARIGEDADSVRGFKYLWRKVLVDGVYPPDAEVWHEGRCGRCGKTLTVPSSIARGIGPECAGKMMEAM